MVVPGQLDLLNETLNYNFKNILDLGLGDGYATNFFLKNKKLVTATGYDIESYNPPEKLKSKIKIYEKIDAQDLSIFKDNSFDAIWCSHVLEHCKNTHLVLNELYRILKPNGYLFIMVPPYKTKIVGGHINIGWIVGSLAYNLLLAGFNIKKGSFIKYKYNVCAFVQKDISLKKKLPKNLFYDKNDIEKLKIFLPTGMDYHAFEGNIHRYNWMWKRNKNNFYLNYIYSFKESLRLKIENGLNYIISKF